MEECVKCKDIKYCFFFVITLFSELQLVAMSCIELKKVKLPGFKKNISVKMIFLYKICLK